MRSGEESEVLALVMRGFDEFVRPGFSGSGAAEFTRAARNFVLERAAGHEITVAEYGARTVGHIAFSKAGVGDSEPDWFLLGPVAVLPGVQGQGIGSALVESGLAELRTRYARGCVLVGDPGYYSRFGFSTFPDLSYEGVPPEYVLGLPFTEANPRGSIVANKAFEIEPESGNGCV